MIDNQKFYIAIGLLKSLTNNEMKKFSNFKLCGTSKFAYTFRIMKYKVYPFQYTKT